MSLEDNLNFYEKVKDDFKFYGISAVRMKIMISLMDGPKKTKHLREMTGIQSSTILHSISELEKQKIVLRDGDIYCLSEIGQIITPKLIDMIKAMVVLKNSQNILMNHQIDAIPEDLLREIGELSNSMLIESDNVNISKTHENHIEIVLKSLEIKGVSPIFYPIYSEIFKGIIEKDIKVELILTEEVLNKTISSLENGMEDMKNLLSTGNLVLWTINDVKVAFTVTDKFITLGLFFPNERYDTNKNIFSDDKDAIQWANKLFEYYRQRATRFML